MVRSTRVDIFVVLDRLGRGDKVSEIAKDFGVSPSNIYYLLRARNIAIKQFTKNDNSRGPRKFAEQLGESPKQIAFRIISGLSTTKEEATRVGLSCTTIRNYLKAYRDELLLPGSKED